MKQIIHKFVYDEDGASTIEIAIITMALIALALVFKKQALSLAETIAKKILG